MPQVDTKSYKWGYDDGRAAGRMDGVKEQVQLLREREEGRRIARALYPVLAKLRALERLHFYFGNDGTSVWMTLKAWDALLVEGDKAREAIRRESNGA